MYLRLHTFQSTGICYYKKEVSLRGVFYFSTKSPSFQRKMKVHHRLKENILARSQFCDKNVKM